MIGQGNTETDRIPNFIPTFEVRAKEDPAASKAAGHVVFKDVEYCVMIKKGTGAQTPEAIPRLQKNQILWPLIEPHYEAWKKKLEPPVDGFPLEQWPGASRAQVENLKQLNIRSVQDVAVMGDAAMMRVGMGAMALKQRAQAWLASANDTGKVAEEMAALKAENAEQASTIKQLQADMAELRSAMERAQPRDIGDTRRPAGRQQRRGNFVDIETGAAPE